MVNYDTGLENNNNNNNNNRDIAFLSRTSVIYYMK